MKSKKQIFFGLFIVLILALVVFFIISSTNDLDGILDILTSANGLYLTISLALILLYFAMWPLSLCAVTKSKGLKISFKDTYKIGTTEHFFNGITPFATGGQPYQAYAFHKKGVSLADSSSILLINLITFMLVSNIFALISLFYYEKFTAADVNLDVLIIFGFSINLLVFVIFTSLLATDFAKKIVLKLFDLLMKINKLEKFLAPKKEQFIEYFTSASITFKELIKDKVLVLKLILIKTATMFVYYSITFFVLKALYIDVSINDLLYVLFATSFAITMVIFIPTPGASGGVEFAFQYIFMSIAGMTSALALSAMLLWRFITYYLTMFLSFICFLKGDKNHD